MTAPQLKETTMAKGQRTLLRVVLGPDDKPAVAEAVERLMGNRPESRFAFIQARAAFAAELVDL